MYGSLHQSSEPEDKKQHQLAHQVTDKYNDEIAPKNFKSNYHNKKNNKKIVNNVIKSTSQPHHTKSTELIFHAQPSTTVTSRKTLLVYNGTTPTANTRLLPFFNLSILCNSINALIIKHERYFTEKVNNVFVEKKNEKHNYDNYVQYNIFRSQQQLQDTFISSQQLRSSSTIAPKAVASVVMKAADSLIQLRSSSTTSSSTTTTSTCKINNLNDNHKNNKNKNKNNEYDNQQNYQRQFEPKTQTNDSFSLHKKPSIYITAPASLTPFGNGNYFGSGSSIKNSICLYVILSIFITLFYLTIPIAAYDSDGINPM